MADTKRYYWLKLQNDFFSSKRIKKLRKIAGGDTYTIIYLKMQLLSIKTDGVLTYTGLESSFADELALDLDEDAENVAVTLQYLASCGLIETSDNIEFLLPYVLENTGSETASAQRQRDFRNRQKALHCNTDVTQLSQTRNVEIEIERERELETEKNNIYVGKKDRFTPPTLDQVKDYCIERNNNVDAQRFIDYYESKGWLVGKSKMKNWKAAVRTWEGNDKRDAKNKPKSMFEKIMEVDVGES